MSLIRQILLEVEAQPYGSHTDDLKIEGYSDAEVAYHTVLLIEANFLRAFDTTYMESEIEAFSIERLTWDGHEFIDNARDDTIWKKFRAAIANVGGTVSLPVATQMLAQLVNTSIGQ